MVWYRALGRSVCRLIRHAWMADCCYCLPGDKTMEMKALEDLLAQELMELYAAEQDILKALPKMIRLSADAGLRAAFKLHLKQTDTHVQRLNKIFGILKRDAESVDCEPIAAIVKQTETLTANKQSDPTVLDAALISAAQKIEHYEIALYGTAQSHSQLLGYLKISDLLSQTLREEKETDALLMRLAEKRINLIAAKAPFGQARTGPRASASRGGGVVALISSLLVGAAVAILYAPRSGGEIRRELKARADSLKERLAGERRGEAELRTMDDEGYMHASPLT